jgi:hypothetical protein
VNLTEFETTMSRRWTMMLRITVSAIVIAVVGWLLPVSGVVSGTEFSPDLFCHRAFRYYQWCGVQVTPTSTSQWRTSIDDYVHANGFARGATTDEPRWHFIKGFRPGLRGWSGSAKSMCHGLGCFRGDHDRWAVWSKQNPELSAVVWTQVVEWARRGEYPYIGCLFRFTELEGAVSVAEVQAKIEQAKAFAHR